MNKLNRNTLIDIVKTIAKEESVEGFKIIGVFGSYAHNTQTEFSDVDIAYKIDRSVFSQKYEDGFSKLLKIDEVKTRLQEQLHKRVDLISLDSKNTKLNQNILKDIIYV